ncbi:MAG TPA: beta-propeller fold lactonase family protein, partial [Gemmatimonadaceae bacterium]|nr:beta-propeller fold lactonase family protein [Gemmatimonadaceae bacterium]
MWRRAMAAAIVAGVAIGCTGEKKAPAPDTTAAAVSKPARTDFSSGGPYLFVSNEDGNDVTVIDSKNDSVVATLDPGQRPRGIRVTPDGKKLIVAVSGSPKGGPGVDEKTLPPADRTKDGIAVIDLATGKREANLPGGLDPESFAISADGKTIYVSNEDGGTLTLIDVDSRKIAETVKIGSEPEGVQIRPDGKVLFATNEGSGTVSVLDLASKKIVATIPTGKRPRGIAFTPDSKKAYITNEVGGTVTVVDAQKHRVLKNIKIPGEGAKPMGTAMSPDGTRLYVTTGRGGTAVVIDTKADTVVSTFPVGKRPWGIAVSAD